MRDDGKRVMTGIAGVVVDRDRVSEYRGSSIIGADSPCLGYLCAKALKNVVSGCSEMPKYGIWSRPVGRDNYKAIWVPYM